MRHINPTLTAHTRPFGGACSHRAGTAPEKSDPKRRELKSYRIEALSTYPLPMLSPLQRVQLSEITRQTLDEEMSLLGLVVRMLKRAIQSEEEETLLKRLAELMDILGLTASRTASVLRVENAINTAGGEDPRIKEILASLQKAMLADEPQKAGE